MYINEEVIQEVTKRTGYPRAMVEFALTRLWEGVRAGMAHPECSAEGMRLGKLKVELNYLWVTQHTHSMLLGNVRMDKMAYEAYRPMMWLKVLDKIDETTSIYKGTLGAITGKSRKQRWRERLRDKQSIDYAMATEAFEEAIMERVKAFNEARHERSRFLQTLREEE